LLKLTPSTYIGLAQKLALDEVAQA
jgi:hypothetical protein